jgi:Putative peptidoglycan binding domain
MNKTSKTLGKVVGILLLSAFVLSDTTLAHPGRTNSEGCHTNKKTGSYHCHGGGGSSGSSGSGSSGGNYNSGGSSGRSYNYPPVTIENLESCSISVKLGMKGEAVGAVQKYLAKLNYLPMNAPDGVFGQETDAAVKKYQEDKDLTVDGIVGCKTFAALEADVEN